ncbi:XopG/HopH/AvrPtoH family type III secretion system effector [Acidovorax sp. SUPP2825]|uniref:XopG/HopH/AvrPtoH family type III secretion system effector n=1 Tax=Acidovorax sp. SUPP2825 TaxID=2920879 RepID=UPI0023DE2C97|nr:XopG/HopH/AvrPtoH family type III secretion system effector [Acidovorax sp. SUPP2825]GKS97691.1 type III secretion system effector protein [Acidovorax sp. SUPP2825]
MPIETNYRGVYSQSINDSNRDSQRFNAEVNLHLDTLGSGSTGNQLLNDLVSLSNQRRHKVTIHEMKASPSGPSAEPVLSRHQREQHPTLNSFRDIRETAGRRYALKTQQGPNEGSSVVVTWTAHQTSMGLDEDGDPTGPTSSNRDKVSLLAHELVHAKHMMAGTWKGSYDDSRDPETASGKEELRAVGIGKYKYSETGQPSENSVRAEHGLPKRSSYHYSGYRSD